MPPVIPYSVTITCASLCSTHDVAISNVINVIAIGVLIMGAASSVGVTSFLICLRRAVAIGPWRTAVLVDELNAGGPMRIPNLIRYAGSKPRASATSRGDRSPVVPTRRLRLHGD